MKTPIQEFLEEKKYHYYPDICKKCLEKEKEFAKQCFEAGIKHGMDISYSCEWAEDIETPDFEQFYKKFEK